MQNKNLEERLMQHSSEFAPVVPFEPTDKLLLMDFTESNKELTDEVVKDTNKFIVYINAKLKAASAKYGIGGYGENRTIYRRSKIFEPGGPTPATPSRWDSSTLTPPTGDEPLVQDSTINTGSLKSKGYEQEDDSMNLAEEDTVGYRFADPFMYRLLREYALQNRSVPTQAEAILWEALKTKKLSDYKFRRQHIIDRFITDFVCLKRRVVIEVDGLIHQLPQNKESDEQRTGILKGFGFNVIRFTNDEVLHQLEKVTEEVLVALEKSEVVLPPILLGKVDENTASPPSKGCAAGGPSHREGSGMGRSVHLGIDIWGPPYTRIMAPLDGIIHSFAFNNAYGDYGATIILTHNLHGESFHTLYGHLSLNSLQNLAEGDAIKKGDVFAQFGIPFENGQWPPHLHFQLIKDMQEMKGDYPGVCALSEREMYLSNCPDADLILQMMQYAAR